MRVFKSLCLFAIGLAVGVLATQVPDLICVYADHVVGKYQKSECSDKHISPDKCEFDMYFDKYKAEHPQLDKLHGYFLFGESTLYFVITSRCSDKRMFHNPSAAPKDTGKITTREYFFGRCSELMNDITDKLGM